MRLLLVPLLVLCAADAGPGPASPFEGGWKIDPAACSDLAPLLEHYQANFFIRNFAGAVAPTDLIRWKGDRFELEVHALVWNRTTTVFLDGKTRTADDLFGNPYEYTSVLEGGAVVSKGSITRADGTIERFDLVRTIEVGDRMVTRMTIFPKGARPLKVTRVFRRLPAD